MTTSMNTAARLIEKLSPPVQEAQAFNVAAKLDELQSLVAGVPQASGDRLSQKASTRINDALQIIGELIAVQKPSSKSPGRPVIVQDVSDLQSWDRKSHLHRH